MEKINLHYPIKINGQEIKSLTLRRPKVRDHISISQTKESDQEKELRLFANLCEVAPADLHELDISDYAQIQETYKGFLSLK